MAVHSKTHRDDTPAPAGRTACGASTGPRRARRSMPSRVSVALPPSPRARADRQRRKGAGMLLAGVVVSLCVALPVRGQAERRILSAASSLNGMLSLFPTTGIVRKLTLNGAEVRLRASGTSESLNSVVQRLETACGSVVAGPESHPRRDDSYGTEGTLLPIPIWRVQSKNEALVACLAPAAPLTLSGLRRMSRHFSASSDLASWGSFGFAHAVTTSERTSILVAATGRALDLARMFPASGDAPGSDLPHLPRPEGRRVLTVSLDETPLLAAYEAQRAPLAAIASYAKHLETAGFTVKRQHHHTHQKQALVARGSGVTAIATVSPAAAPGRTSKQSTLTLAVLPR